MLMWHEIGAGDPDRDSHLMDWRLRAWDGEILDANDMDPPAQS